MTVRSSRAVDPAADGITIVDRAVREVLGNRGRVTPCVEAEVQKALDMLRGSRCDTAQLARVERISTALFTLALAKVSSRINLHESQLLRLSRLAS
jgi:hypothetical protein